MFQIQEEVILMSKVKFVFHLSCKHKTDYTGTVTKNGGPDTVVEASCYCKQCKTWRTITKIVENK